MYVFWLLGAGIFRIVDILNSKAIPLQAWTCPEGLQDVEAPRFQYYCL